jgi:4-hydroxy-tetrahydrodipicolinate synthase
MVAAKDARDWAATGGLDGLGDSLYTPFSGADGDDIDWDAYRVLVRYCIGDLGHDMLWTTSGCGEWWALTIDERKRLLEVAIEEGRAIKPDLVVQACTTSACAKDALELTRHAQEVGADICFLQTPPMEVHAGEGMIRFFKYIADRTDIALGMFNTPGSVYEMTGEEMAGIANAIPAVVAVKEGVMDSVVNTLSLHALAPEVVIWECDTWVYEAGWLEDGIVGPGQLGNIGYLQESPSNRTYRQYWELIWDGKLREAREFRKQDLQVQTLATYSARYATYPERPGYLTHWGEPLKIASEIIGLPVGDYKMARSPQGTLRPGVREEIRALYEEAGLAGVANQGKAVSHPVDLPWSDTVHQSLVAQSL